MRIVFLGSQRIGARCLEVVIEQGHEVVGVATFSPEPHEQWVNDVDVLVERHGLPVLDVRRFKDPAELQALQAAAPDLTLVIGWRWLLPEAVLAVPLRGTVGIHGSLLPRLRGFAPVNWALIRDEETTGPTMFYIDEGMDTGDIIASTSFALTDDDDAATVRQRIEDESVELVRTMLPRLSAGNAPRQSQRHELATFGAQRRPRDGEIDWSTSSREIFNFVRGITHPYPGAVAAIGGIQWRVWKVRPLDAPPGQPGTVLTTDADGAPRIVSSCDGQVEIISLESIRDS